jgi:hypothetical protein
VRRVNSEAAAQVMRRAGFAPVEPYQSPRTPWKCRCGKCKRLVKVKLANVQRGFKRCPECRNDERITVMRAAGAQPLIPYPGRASGGSASARDAQHRSSLVMTTCGVARVPAGTA